ncbi:hypothetical protein XELAEV_18009462mg [Xenopus laevis]|uniref:Uncharacterized protein n=1 Tax=Xenopus laevis TaxID=8355 RepID=A0A974I0G0_XENLA|nr:hypothetical protein XELAEV_18009462mg [Xenopus laevis]
MCCPLVHIHDPRSFKLLYKKFFPSGINKSTISIKVLAMKIDLYTNVRKTTFSFVIT